MEKLLITGGKKLSGSVKISGSKNSALPILIASLLTDEKVILHNVPNLKDVDVTISIIEYLGKKVIRKNNTVIVTQFTSAPKDKGYIIAPYELIKKMRASFLVSGALLARNKKVKVALPGGCTIGVRPVDIHIAGFEQFGIKHHLEEGYVVFQRDKLSSAKINFRYPSVGATENMMLVASLIPDETVIYNAAREPEIQDLAIFLSKLGVKVYGAGTNVVRIIGKKKLSCNFPNGQLEHTIIPDRIEAGTYMISAGITKGEIVLENVVPEHLTALTKKLVSAGLKIEISKDKILTKWVKKLIPQNVITKPYPGFPTDLQAQFMALMSVTKGVSIIRETVFENRFLHIAELNRMGANIVVDGNKAIVYGVEKLKSAEVMVSDLRAGAALVLAGLAAEGTTKISHIYHLDRGYENIEKKLSLLGAEIKRIEE